MPHFLLHPTPQSCLQLILHALLTRRLVPLRLQLLDSLRPTLGTQTANLYFLLQPLVSASPTHSMITRAKTSIRKPNPKYAYHVLVLSSTDGTVELTSFS